MRELLRNALERLFAVSIRAAKTLRTRMGRASPGRDDGTQAPGTETPTQPPGDTDFLEQVSEALRNIDSFEQASSTPLDPRTPAARLREALRRHGDALLAAALLAGILILVIHWVR